MTPEAQPPERGPPHPWPIVRRLRRYLVAGLLVWLPLLAVIFVIRFLVRLMDRSLLLLPAAYRPDTLLGIHIPGLGIVLTVLLLLVTGVLAANLVGRRFVAASERLLARIPLVRSVYSGVKHATEHVLDKGKRPFQRVVLVEHPQPLMWRIGFQTSEQFGRIHANLPDDLVCVFLPATPNVASGYIVLVSRAQVVELDIPVDDALKLVMSLGVVLPKWREIEAEIALARVSGAP